MNTCGGAIIPITLLSLYGREKNTRISSFHTSPQCGWCGKKGFKLMLDDLSWSREQDWACGMKEMSSDAIGVG